MNARTIKATEAILRTNTFDRRFGAWSFIVLEGEIEMIERELDGVFQVYHLKLLPGAVLMHYRANESGIQSAKIYYNDDQANSKPVVKQKKISSIAIVQS